MEKYLYIPIRFLETQNISKCDFMKSNPKSVSLLNALLNKISPHLQIKDIFLIKNYFLLILENKDTIFMENESNFLKFSDFISSTNWAEFVSINNKKRELSIKKDVPPIFYYILNEFLI